MAKFFQNWSTFTVADHPRTAMEAKGWGVLYRQASTYVYPVVAVTDSTLVPGGRALAFEARGIVWLVDRRTWGVQSSTGFPVGSRFSTGTGSLNMEVLMMWSPTLSTSAPDPTSNDEWPKPILRAWIDNPPASPGGVGDDEYGMAIGPRSGNPFSSFIYAYRRRLNGSETVMSNNLGNVGVPLEAGAWYFTRGRFDLSTGGNGKVLMKTWRSSQAESTTWDLDYTPPGLVPNSSTQFTGGGMALIYNAHPTGRQPRIGAWALTNDLQNPVTVAQLLAGSTGGSTGVSLPASYLGLVRWST